MVSLGPQATAPSRLSEFILDERLDCFFEWSFYASGLTIPFCAWLHVLWPVALGMVCLALNNIHGIIKTWICGAVRVSRPFSVTRHSRAESPWGYWGTMLAMLLGAVFLLCGAAIAFAHPEWA